MRIIIAGSRGITDYGTVLKAIGDSGWVPTTILSGTAKGVDLLGERFANEYNIPLERFPANWDFFGKRAGFVRNEEMARNADALLAIWDGKSRGTEQMIKIASRLDLIINVSRVYK